MGIYIANSWGVCAMSYSTCPVATSDMMRFEDAEPNPRFTGYIEDHDDMDPIYIADQLNKNNWVLLSDGVQLFDKGVINTPVNRSTYLNFIHYHIIKHPLTQREIRAVYELDRDGQLRVDRGRVVRLPCPRAADRSLMAQYDGSAYQHVVAEARRTHSLTHPAAALSPSDTNIDVECDAEVMDSAYIESAIQRNWRLREEQHARMLENKLQWEAELLGSEYIGPLSE